MIATMIQGIWIGSSAMSISSMFFIVACMGMYKLGAFNARHPGQMLECGKWLWRWMNQ